MRSISVPYSRCLGWLLGVILILSVGLQYTYAKVISISTMNGLDLKSEILVLKYCEY